MIGNAPSISDIVLTELPPDAVDLYCDEEMPPEEEEPEARDVYQVAADCGICDRRVRFVCLAFSEDIHNFHQQLFSVSFVCLSCVKALKLNHGG